MSETNNKRQDTENKPEYVTTSTKSSASPATTEASRANKLKSRPPPTVAAIVFPTTGDGEEKSNTNNKRVEKRINQNLIIKKHIKCILYNYNVNMI